MICKVILVRMFIAFMSNVICVASASVFHHRALTITVYCLSIVCWPKTAAGVCGTAIFKVRVVTSLFGRDTSSWIVDEHHLQELQAIVIEICAKRHGIVTLPLRKRGLEVGEGCNSWPVLLGRRSKKTILISLRFEETVLGSLTGRS